MCIKPTAAELSAVGGNLHLLTIYHKHGGGGWVVLDTFVDGGYVCSTVYKFSLFGLGIPQMPETGFTPGVVTDLQDQPAEKEYFNVCAGDSHFASDCHLSSTDTFRLEIPALNVEMPIVGVPLTIDGWDVSWLGDSAGYLEGTAYPTWAGNTALTAHVWDADNNPGPFVDLHTLKHGDEIIIHAWGRKHVYEVRALTEVRPNDLRVLPHSEYDVLTLIPCLGFDESIMEYDWRLAVRAVLINVK